MEEKVKGIINTETVCVDVADIIYNQGKAGMFNVLESQIDEQNKLYACKRIVENMLKGICRNTTGYLKDILGDWQIEVEAGGILSGKDEKEARESLQEIKGVIGIK